ncbi:hypothetical protein D9V86_01785 [Bacteroidetes/Chlorobi group bacterium ChocPot_Mid]|jgi:hypothetical protein|nr:MAG: hypothetical protein D9V86_01785 [Bacteroidetes/Chlorobi group bacterium ChocPot_Mid]
MGIHSEFKYGIELYDFSFAFSNLREDEISEAEDVRKNNSGLRFLASISKELFNPRVIQKKPRKLKSHWVLTCL